MTITQTADTGRADDQGAAARGDAAYALHRAEIAPHEAHQTQVDEWITAANDRLHDALVRYLAADALASGPRGLAVAA